jgi:hypothetical protein
MLRHTNNGLVWYTFEGPDQAFRHALLTRRGGTSRGALHALNLGHTVGDDPEAVAENHRRVYRAFDLTKSQVVSPHQVHGRTVTRVTRSDGGSIIPRTDALITDDPGTALLMRFADCTPVLFYDAVHHAAGLAHAGWRGTAAGVIAATISAMQATFGSRPAELWAGVGPAIDAAHYEVGEEVVNGIKATLPDNVSVTARHNGSVHLNLPGAVAAQLVQAGVGRVELSGLYTAADLTSWYSHRAEQGKTGRFGVWVMLA